MKYKITYPLIIEIEADSEEEMWRKADDEIDELLSTDDPRLYIGNELHKHSRIVEQVNE